MGIQYGSTPITEIKHCDSQGVLHDVHTLVRNGNIIWGGIPNYLTFTSQSNNSSITFSYTSGSAVKYRVNNGDWTACPSGTSVTGLAVNDAVQYKGLGVATNHDNHFVMSGTLAGSGSVTSLIDGIGGNPNVNLPSRCCYHMFWDCASLVSAPSLIATKASFECYCAMFNNCTSLVSAPVISLIKLDDYCCYAMFVNCSNLKISENGGVGEIILNVPSQSSEYMYWNFGMFANTRGSFTGDPQIGVPYYCYQ